MGLWVRCLQVMVRLGLDTRSNESVPVWRAPEGPEGLAAVPVGGGRAWPGFETTRRAKLAARTASGRAAAHGHTKQPGRDSGTSPGHPNPITHTLARALSPGLAHRRKRPPL